MRWRNAGPWARKRTGADEASGMTFWMRMARIVLAIVLLMFC